MNHYPWLISNYITEDPDLFNEALSQEKVAKLKDRYFRMVNRPGFETEAEQTRQFIIRATGVDPAKPAAATKAKPAAATKAKPAAATNDFLDWLKRFNLDSAYQNHEYRDRIHKMYKTFKQQQAASQQQSQSTFKSSYCASCGFKFPNKSSQYCANCGWNRV